MFLPQIFLWPSPQAHSRPGHPLSYMGCAVNATRIHFLSPGVSGIPPVDLGPKVRGGLVRLCLKH